MDYLFSLSLGPAQEFIAAARRTRDLWFSSWLLSELSKAAAKEIGKERLIFPSVSDDRELEPGSEFNVANKILAKVDDDPQRLGEGVKAAVRNRLNEIREEAFRDLPAGSCNLDKAKAQIDDLGLSLVEVARAGGQIPERLFSDFVQAVADRGLYAFTQSLRIVVDFRQNFVGDIEFAARLQLAVIRDRGKYQPFFADLLGCGFGKLAQQPGAEP